MAARSTLTVTSGTTITSAWGNSMRDHVVPKTTSNDVSSEGQLAVNTSTDQLVVHNGSAAVQLVAYGAWSTWTPGITQGTGGVLSLTTLDAKTTKMGKTVKWSLFAVVNTVTAPTAGAGIYLAMPSTPRQPTGVAGYGHYYDASTGLYHPIYVSNGTGSSLQLLTQATDTGTPNIGGTITLAASDEINLSGEYEEA